MVGVVLNILKKEKLYRTRPNWLFQLNYGILGTKHIKQNNPDTTGGGILFQNSVALPYDIPPNYHYYTKEHYVKNIGWSFSVIKEFKLNDYFFFGLGVGKTFIKDKGYLIWENPFNKDIIKKDINIDVSTIFILSNIGYHYDIDNKWFISALLNLYFHIPINRRSKDDNRYETNSPFLPTVGTEQNFSLSINYKF